MCHGPATGGKPCETTIEQRYRDLDEPDCEPEEELSDGRELESDFVSLAVNW